MKRIYREIWKLAKPYYQKGRIYDVEQVEWMMKEADRIADIVKADKKLLIPIIILHDVGYSVIKEDNPDIKDRESKKIHMREGAKIARRILEQVDYDSELAERIVYYVSVHDNWVLGDDAPFKECKEMALFNDLDFLYQLSGYRAFKLAGESIGKATAEMYDFWLNDEKLVRRPFCCQETKRMFEQFMEERKKEIKK